MRHLLLVIALAACGSSASVPGAPGSPASIHGVTDGRTVPAFTPPRALPEVLAAAGRRCVSGDGAGCGEVTAGLVARGVPWVLIDPWARRGCDLRDGAACDALGEQVLRLFLSWHELMTDDPVPPGLLPRLIGLCERGDWKICARLAGLHGLSECPAAQLAHTHAEIEADPELTRRALTLARPVAQAACDAGAAQACSWLGAMFARECGYGIDRPRAEALFAKALTHAGEVERCRGGDLKACGGVFQDCTAFEGALTTRPEADASPVVLPIARSLASSSLPPWKGYRFGVEHLHDGDLTTSWQPLDKRHGGEGQWVELHFAEPRVVSAIQIANGFQRRDAIGDLFLLNARLWRFRLEFSDHTMEYVDLDPSIRGRVRIEFSPRVVRGVRLVVGATRPGEKWQDLAISEIELLGNRDKPALVEDALPSACGLPSTVAKAPCDAGDWRACGLHHGYARRGERRAAQQLAVATGEKLCAAPGHPEVCHATAELLVRLDGPSARASALANRGCSLGAWDACAALGCHGDFPGAGSPSPDFQAAKGVCARGCEAGEIHSCLALSDAKFPGFASDLSHPENKRYRARLRGCTDVDSCLGVIEAVEALDGRDFAADATTPLRLVGAAELACELGSAAGCAALAVAAAEFPIGEAAGRRACELDPGPCGASRSEEPEPDLPDLADLIRRCGHHESDACSRACEGLGVFYDTSLEDGEALEALVPHAQPALGMSAELLLAMCAEYDLANQP